MTVRLGVETLGEGTLGEAPNRTFIVHQRVQPLHHPDACICDACTTLPQPRVGCDLDGAPAFTAWIDAAAKGFPPPKLLVALAATPAEVKEVRFPQHALLEERDVNENGAAGRPMEHCWVIECGCDFCCNPSGPVSAYVSGREHDAHICRACAEKAVALLRAPEKETP